MRSQIAGLFCAPTAQMTHIRIFIGMQSLVHKQRWWIAEALFTKFTFEWPFARVCPKMYVQTIASAKGSWTLWTEISFEININCRKVITIANNYHLYGRSPVCLRIWHFNVSDDLKASPQISQMTERFCEWVLTCFRSSVPKQNFFGQTAQQKIRLADRWMRIWDWIWVFVR